MITNPKKTCLVLDLDDTLYKEYDYQTSGLKYMEEQVLELYDVDLRGKLLELRDQGVNDIFLELTNILNIPSSIKDSFLMMYRYHKPNIALTLGTKKFIESALHDYLKDKLRNLKGARGCITLQLFVNLKEKSFKAIEINPRFGGGYPLSYSAGANFPKMLIQEYILEREVDFLDDWEDNLLMLRYDSKVLIHDHKS